MVQAAIISRAIDAETGVSLGSGTPKVSAANGTISTGLPPILASVLLGSSCLKVLLVGLKMRRS